ncbi:hypothetical protein [Ruminococcus albus]|uniref:Uncharacterized protein n=1 Tax=Ruminococcus albus TaxID=1264 RepID=A0A1I1IND2_RUMAL|nr:hypothetical protein [Ruminococcus albus]SFC35263.1 hypothetical protein SAMN02910406_01579 [Ruminococcus albus]
MKTNSQRRYDALKGAAAALLIAVCFFAFSHRLPQKDDIKGLTALMLVCAGGSSVGLMTDSINEDILSQENAEDSFI